MTSARYLMTSGCILTLRASTVLRAEGVLREFACWLAGNAPEVVCVAGLRRRHI